MQIEHEITGIISTGCKGVIKFVKEEDSHWYSQKAYYSSTSNFSKPKSISIKVPTPK